MEGGEAKINMDTANLNLRTKAEGMKIDMAGKTDAEIKDGIIQFREKQDFTSRLCEYLTGLRLNDPGLIEKIDHDQQSVLAKYGLSGREYRINNPTAYEDSLRKLAEVNGVLIRNKSDCGDFFEKYNVAGAVFQEKNNVIGIDIDKTDIKTYNQTLIDFEHETIHSLQHKYTPEMPIEFKEYEAYIATWNIKRFRNNSDFVELSFSFEVANSIDHYYRSESETRGEKVEPEWNNPEYFLKKVDGINEEKIQEYKSKQAVNDTQKESLDNVRV